MLSDLQVVQDGSGEGTFGCIRNQLRSLGSCNVDVGDHAVGHHVLLDILDSRMSPALENASGRNDVVDVSQNTGDTMPTVPILQVWCVCTDAGSDEKKAREYLHAMAAHSPHTVVFDTDCLAHQYQRMVLSLLEAGDKLFKDSFGTDFSYSACLSKFMIVCREHARAIFDEWSKQWGAAEALKFARSIPPKCIRGRWGSVSRCEQHALKPLVDHLVSVLQAVAGAGMRKRRNPGLPGLDRELHEVDVHEADQYSERMSKWRRDVLEQMVDARFWVMMRINLQVRAPLDHLMHYLMKRHAAEPGDP